MVTTANIIELQNLLSSLHKDPHHILGMHELKILKKNEIVVRAFIPQAEKIFVVDLNDETLQYEMSCVHVDGFFEVIVPKRKTLFGYKLKVTDTVGNVWETRDPYSFLPTISQMDLYLFGEGTHYEIFNKLGAHVIEVDGVCGVSFAVWAPNAARVSVIGDFNSWDGRRNQMRMLQQSGIWEIFIPGLKNFDRYKFEIKTATGQLLQKIDPYGHFQELRPSHSMLVFDIEKHKWKDSKWLEKRHANNPIDGALNIYEVHLGSWKRVIEDGNRFMSYLELAGDLIPYVKEMGYTHIELMPVLEYPFDGSWGYQVTGYFAPTSRYGTPDEFMEFVDLCHQNNIGVILDWVPGHFPKDAHALAKFDGTALYEHSDPRQGEQPEWGTLLYNYGRKEVKNFLIGNAIFWLEKYHIDGLRVDAVASMLYLNYGKSNGGWIPNKYGGNENLEAAEFLKHMNSVILGRMPHVMMIAEESTAYKGVSRPVEENGLGFNLKWNMGWMNDMLRYVVKEPIHRKYHHGNLTFGMVYAYTENFVLVLSHDEVVHGKGSLVNKMPGDYWQKFANLRLFFAFMFGHPGKKLVFMGGEIAQFTEWSEERSLDWFLLEYKQHRELQTFVKDLNHLYLKENSLWFDDFTSRGFDWIDCNDANRSIVSFVRKGKTKKDILIFVCNFTPNVITKYRLGVPIDGKYVEVLNSDDVKYGGSGVVNDGVLESEQIEFNNLKQSVEITVPPLATIVLKPTK